jgi:hypothetical protein
MTALIIAILTLLWQPVPLMAQDALKPATILQPAYNNPQATVHSYYIKPAQLTSYYQPALHRNELHNLTVYKLEVK